MLKPKTIYQSGTSEAFVRKLLEKSSADGDQKSTMIIGKWVKTEGLATEKLQETEGEDAEENRNTD
jgi:hypothetical protein